MKDLKIILFLLSLSSLQTSAKEMSQAFEELESRINPQELEALQEGRISIGSGGGIIVGPITPVDPIGGDLDGGGRFVNPRLLGMLEEGNVEGIIENGALGKFEAQDINSTLGSIGDRTMANSISLDLERTLETLTDLFIVQGAKSDEMQFITMAVSMRIGQLKANELFKRVLGETNSKALDFYLDSFSKLNLDLFNYLKNREGTIDLNDEVIVRHNDLVASLLVDENNVLKKIINKL